MTITAYGTNNLTSSGAYAAIQKNGSGKLVLTSTTKGTINATAGNNATYGAAGIGGGTDKTLKVVSNIEINGNVIIKARDHSHQMKAMQHMEQPVSVLSTICRLMASGSQKMQT